jgi:hypothetical protein
MAEPTGTHVRAIAPKKGSKVVEYLAVVVIVGIVVAAAAFQEQIMATVKLRLWDRDAAGRTVVKFLNAGKNHDRSGADAQLGTDVYKPLEEKGKWVGYFVVSQGGTMHIPFSDLLPAGEPKPKQTEFITVGKGAAEVFLPNAKGRDVKYRLEMQQNEWKITEILGGHPAPPPPASGKPAKATPPPFARKR